MLIGPIFIKATAGSLQTGIFQGKMIVVASLWDREAFPWQADWYRTRVAQHLGATTDDHFRLWYTDHALHGDEPQLEDPTRVVSYQGVLQQALRDLAAWVEKGTPPPMTTNYQLTDGQVVVPPSAPDRKGVQPVVKLRVNGGERADVSVGTSASFEATIEVPPGAGYAVAAEWDMDGTGSFAKVEKFQPLNASGSPVILKATYSFARAGTYFPVIRVISQREGDTSTPYARIQNLARVRVVVQ